MIELFGSTAVDSGPNCLGSRRCKAFGPQEQSSVEGVVEQEFKCNSVDHWRIFLDICENAQASKRSQAQEDKQHTFTAWSDVITIFRRLYIAMSSTSAKLMAYHLLSTFASRRRTTWRPYEGMSVGEDYKRCGRQGRCGSTLFHES